MIKLVAYIFSVLVSAPLAFAQAPSAPLTFATWKQQQVTEAQLQIQRLTSARAEDKRMVRAREALAMASELTVEEYISVYLSSIQNDRDKLVKVLEKLNKDETADLVSSLLKRSDAEHKQASPLTGQAANNLVKTP